MKKRAKGESQNKNHKPKSFSSSLDAPLYQRRLPNFRFSGSQLSQPLLPLQPTKAFPFPWPNLNDSALFIFPQRPRSSLFPLLPRCTFIFPFPATNLPSLTRTPTRTTNSSHFQHRTQQCLSLSLPLHY